MYFIDPISQSLTINNNTFDQVGRQNGNELKQLIRVEVDTQGESVLDIQVVECIGAAFS